MDHAHPWTVGDLEKLGVSERQLRKKLRDGSFQQLRWGAYTTAEELTPEDRHQLLIAATVAFVDPSNVFSHTSAAVLHGLPVRRAALKVATMIRVTPGHGNGDPSLRVRNTRLAGDQITEINGLRVTSLSRTVCDQARLAPFEWGVATADAALRQGVSREELNSTLARFPRLHGVDRARQVIRFADGLAESPAESISRVTMARYGLPEPVLQYEVIDENGEVVSRADFAWLDKGVLGEMDGEWKYGELLKPNETAAHVVMREKRQEQRLRQLGWWQVNWGWKEANDGGLLRPLILGAFKNASPRAS